MVKKNELFSISDGVRAQKVLPWPYTNTPRQALLDLGSSQYSDKHRLLLLSLSVSLRKVE